MWKVTCLFCEFNKLEFLLPDLCRVYCATTFTPNELELFQSIGGNKNVRLIWMHKYITGNVQIKQIIDWKYKDKKWYNPAIIEELKKIDYRRPSLTGTMEGFSAPTISRRRRPTTEEDSCVNSSATLGRQSNTDANSRPQSTIQKSPIMDLFSESTNAVTVQKLPSFNDLFTNDPSYNAHPKLNTQPSLKESAIPLQTSIYDLLDDSLDPKLSFRGNNKPLAHVALNNKNKLGSMELFLNETFSK